MPSVHTLFARRNVVEADNLEVQERHQNSINMMIAILSLVFLGLVLASCLLYLRRVRQQRKLIRGGGILPSYSDVNHQSTSGFTIQTTDKHGRSSVLVIGRDGQPMLANPQSPPNSRDNVPQIRITFPDEQDEAGRTKNGRVVVVRVGEATVGLEPLQEEQLPAYEKETNSQFFSIDMDQIGGLKEKNRAEFK
jgi:hypothetical protein